MESSSIKDETLFNPPVWGWLVVLSTCHQGVSGVQWNGAKVVSWPWHLWTLGPGFGLKAVDGGVSVYTVLVTPTHDHHITVG